MKECCNHDNKDKICFRKKDKKTFKLPRKFSIEKCKNPRGFTMRSSCAPYRDCYKKQKGGKRSKKRSGKRSGKRSKKQFLYNPENPKKSFDVYIDKNPKDTIHIKYTTLQDVKNTIQKLERLYKNDKYTHKRVWQVAMIMKVRLEVLKDKKPQQYNLSYRYFKHLGERSRIKNKDKKKEKNLRKKHTFKI